jgi:hypothetical protein
MSNGGFRKNSVLPSGGVVLTEQEDNPVALGDVGLWYDGTAIMFVAADGTTVEIGDAISYGTVGDLATAGGTASAGVVDAVARIDHKHALDTTVAVDKTTAQELTNKTLTAQVVKTGLTASGSASNDFSDSTGTFKTSTGANTLGGDTGLAANKNLTMASGTGAVDLSAASGTFKTPTGIETHNGKQNAGATTNLIADPGASGDIPVTTDGVCAITTAGAEVRQLAIPTFIGQRITIAMDVIVTSCTITVATAFDSATHTTIAASAAGKAISLVGVQVAGVKCWRLAYNDGCTLG